MKPILIYLSKFSFDSGTLINNKLKRNVDTLIKFQNMEYSESSVSTGRRRDIEKLQISNLFLQILLFLNVYISTAWILIFLHHLIYKVQTFGKIQTILTICGYIITVPTELLRLHLGYSGNLKSTLSDLAGFWILSSLIQLPIIIYFAVTIGNVTVLIVLQYMMICELCLQIPLCAFLLRRLSARQAEQFHIQLISRQ